MTPVEIAAYAACISAIAAAASAFANWYNSRVYLRTLRNQRTDDCLAAAYHLESRIQRTLANKYLKDVQNAGTADGYLWTLYSDSRDSWRAFRHRFVVARRYQKAVDAAIPDKFANVLF